MAEQKTGRPARTYINQLCENTGWSPEDLPEAMNDRKKWRERARDDMKMMMMMKEMIDQIELLVFAKNT